MKTYSELITYPDYISRFNYLKLNGQAFDMNLEVHRWLNQRFYHTPEWKQARNAVIIRDGGFDLACPDRPIMGRPIIHHLNPITKDDVINRNPIIFDPENLILVSHTTHNAIHYGDENLLIKDPVVRAPGDTCLWR